MPDIAPADATAASGQASPYAATPPDTDDPARHVGEIFRWLTLASETFTPQSFSRIVAAVLLALGKAVLVETERQADRLRERMTPAPSAVRVSATARRVEFDGWDPGDPTES